MFFCELNWRLTNPSPPKEVRSAFPYVQMRLCHIPLPVWRRDWRTAAGQYTSRWRARKRPVLFAPCPQEALGKTKAPRQSIGRSALEFPEDVTRASPMTACCLLKDKPSLNRIMLTLFCFTCSAVQSDHGSSWVLFGHWCTDAQSKIIPLSASLIFAFDIQCKTLPYTHVWLLIHYYLHINRSDQLPSHMGIAIIYLFSCL